MCSMSHSAILLKVGLVNFIIFQLCNEGINNIVTVPLGVESLWEKMGPTMRLRYIPTQVLDFSSCSSDSLNAWGLCAHQTREFWLLMYPDKWKYASSVKNVTSKLSCPSRSRKSKTTCSMLPAYHCCQVSIHAQL
jgi:hypothetical protein